MAEQQSNVQSFQVLSVRFGVLIWRWVLLVCDQALHFGDIVKSKGAGGTREKTRCKGREKSVLARLASLAQMERLLEGLSSLC